MHLENRVNFHSMLTLNEKLEINELIITKGLFYEAYVGQCLTFQLPNNRVALKPSHNI